MAKINPNFAHDLFKFFAKPIRDADKKTGGFLERWLGGAQKQFEEAFDKVLKLTELYDPAKTPQPRYLKDIVGLTSELDHITADITDKDLRKLIALAVSLWKQKGLEIGYQNIIRLFTGKNSRVFNWFAYRWIVGEKAFGEEQLGEDSWIISVPGVIATTPVGNTLAYYSFEQNPKDRSEIGNDAVHHGYVTYFPTGPTLGSNYYIHLNPGAYLTVYHNSLYDLSDDFTVEMFVRTDKLKNSVLFKKSAGTKTIEIRYNSITDEVSYIVTDGAVTATETLVSASSLSNNTWRHIALIVNRTANVARLYLNGAQSTSAASIVGLADMTTVSDFFIGAADHNSELFEGDVDNFRLSASAQYSTAGATIPVPGASFTPYQSEQLDEYYTDIRVVDNGTLNRTLVKRILNLMRPVSERLRVIYIRVFEDFRFGKGELMTEAGSSSIVDKTLKLTPSTAEVCDADGNETFRDIVFQCRMQVTSGNEAGLRFLQTDSQNYYSFKMNFATRTSSLSKFVAGVETVLSSGVPVDIYRNTYYVFMVRTDFDQYGNQTLIRCFYDSNTVHKVFDASHTQGTFGAETFAGTNATIDDIEMFMLPLTVDTVKPGDNP